MVWRCLRMLKWRARQDSNLRPSAPEADALSTELQARGPRSYPVSVDRRSATGFTLYLSRMCTLGAAAGPLVERKLLSSFPRAPCMRTTSASRVDDRERDVE